MEWVHCLFLNLDSPCFRGNIVVTCKIRSFLCSLGAHHLIWGDGSFLKKKIHPLLRLKKKKKNITNLKKKNHCRRQWRKTKINPTPKSSGEMVIFKEKKTTSPTSETKKKKKKSSSIWWVKKKKRKKNSASIFLTRPQLPCPPENQMVRPLDNLVQKNILIFFFGNQISKWRSFEKKGLFLTNFLHFLVTREQLQKFLQHISHSNTYAYSAHPIDFFCLTNFEKKYEFIRYGFSLVWFSGVDFYSRHFGTINK